MHACYNTSWICGLCLSTVLENFQPLSFFSFCSFWSFKIYWLHFIFVSYHLFSQFDFWITQGSFSIAYFSLYNSLFLKINFICNNFIFAKRVNTSYTVFVNISIYFLLLLTSYIRMVQLLKWMNQYWWLITKACNLFKVP